MRKKMRRCGAKDNDFECRVAVAKCESDRFALYGRVEIYRTNLESVQEFIRVQGGLSSDN